MLLLAPSALAASPAVERWQQDQVKSLLAQLGADDLAYVPSRVPAFYRVTQSQTSSGQITLSFTSSKYPPNSAKSERFLIAYGAQPFPRKIGTCGRGAVVSRKVDGKTVFMRQGSVWRCLKAPSGRLVIVFADSPGVSRAEMLRVIASVVRIP